MKIKIGTKCKFLEISTEPKVRLWGETGFETQKKRYIEKSVTKNQECCVIAMDIYTIFIYHPLDDFTSVWPTSDTINNSWEFYSIDYNKFWTKFNEK